ncbi:MAG: hypothetical protein ACLFNR_00280 [Candidatus Paceibacterota bacterium]
MRRPNPYLSALVVFCLYSLPLLVSAQTTFKEFVYGTARDIIVYVIYIIISLSLLSFLWGLTKFILNADSDSGREKGKQVMIWGLVALFVMVSLMGIVQLIRVTLFGDSDDAFLPTNL